MEHLKKAIECFAMSEPDLIANATKGTVVSTSNSSYGLGTAYQINSGLFPPLGEQRTRFDFILDVGHTQQGKPYIIAKNFYIANSAQEMGQTFSYEGPNNDVKRALNDVENWTSSFD